MRGSQKGLLHLFLTPLCGWALLWQSCCHVHGPRVPASWDIAENVFPVLHFFPTPCWAPCLQPEECWGQGCSLEGTVQRKSFPVAVMLGQQVSIVSSNLHLNYFLNPGTFTVCSYLCLMTLDHKFLLTCRISNVPFLGFPGNKVLEGIIFLSSWID